MRSTTLLLGALAATVCAETTTFQLFRDSQSKLPAQGIVASIIDADATATTLALTCKYDCGLIKPITITQGPSTYAASFEILTSTRGVSEEIMLLETCVITSSTQQAYCSASVGVSVSVLGTKTSTSSTVETTISSDEIAYIAVPVTAGAEKLAGPKATATATDAATTTGATSSSGSSNENGATSASESSNENGAMVASGPIGLGQAGVVALAAAVMGLL